jgi:hypothetical protein
VACVVGLLLAGGERAAAKVSPALNTQALTNNTGQPANDLHVKVGGQILSGNPGASNSPNAGSILAFQGSSYDGPSQTTTMNFQSDPSTQQVADGSTVNVNWSSTLNENVTSAQWTQDGNPIGKAATTLISVKMSTITSPTGQQLGEIFVINNTLDPLPYSGLAAYSQADINFFNLEDYISGGAQTGQFSRLSLPPQGTFAPGSNLLATVDPVTGLIFGAGGGGSAPADFQADTAQFFYDVGSVDINGGTFAIAGSNMPAVIAAPEPASLTMLVSAGLSFAAVSGRRLWRRLRTRTADVA